METHEILKRLREAKKLNKKQLAQNIGIPYTTYCNYESGYRGTDSEVLRKIANYYNVTVDYLIGNSDEEIDNLDEIIQAVKERPEMRTLFSKSSKATKEEVLKTIKMLEVFKEDNHDL